MSFIDLLFETVAPEVFATRHWNAAPLHQRHQAQSALAAVTDNLCLNALIESGVLRAPRLRVRRDADWLHDAVFTRGVRLGVNTVEGMADLTALRALQTQGAAIWAGELQRLIPSLGLACRDLAQHLQVPATAAAWMLPAQARIDPNLIAAPRWFIQCSGDSEWVLSPCVAANPESASTKNDPRVLEPLRLQQGDSLFVPAGYQAELTAGVSDVLLLDITLQALTWLDCLRQVVAGVFDALEANSTWRTTAVAASPTQAEVNTWHDCYTTEAQLLKIEEVLLTHFVRNHADPGAVSGVLTALCRGDAEAPEQRWMGRPWHIVAQSEDDDTLTLMCNQKQLSVPQAARETLKFLLRPAPYAVADIPGNLLPKNKQALLTQLLLEGLVIPA